MGRDKQRTTAALPARVSDVYEMGVLRKHFAHSEHNELPGCLDSTVAVGKVGQPKESTTEMNLLRRKYTKNEKSNQ